MPLIHPPFQPGQIYRRKTEIHDVYGGQRMGGISTPKTAPFVLLFTGDAGSEFGYEDTFQNDGLFWYTGEGQVGDMQMLRGNAAIRDHQQQEKSLWLFEAGVKGHVRCVGEMLYLGHHNTQRPDREGQMRTAYVFHLELLSPASLLPLPEVHEPTPRYTNQEAPAPSQRSLQEWRDRALGAALPAASLQQRLIQVRQRAEAIKKYAKMRAKGRCVGCEQPAPFDSKHGPFLEVHHVFRLADGGPDHPAKVVALCPNCHRRAHHSKDAHAFNQKLQAWLAHNEPSP